MPNKCFNCSSKSGILHHAPISAEYRNKWLEVIPDIRETDLIPSFRLCSLHFKDKFITAIGRITRNAVPSKFLDGNGIWYSIESVEFAKKF